MSCNDTMNRWAVPPKVECPCGRSHHACYSTIHFLSTTQTHYIQCIDAFYIVSCVDKSLCAFILVISAIALESRCGCWSAGSSCWFDNWSQRKVHILWVYSITILLYMKLHAWNSMVQEKWAFKLIISTTRNRKKSTRRFRRVFSAGPPYYG